MKPGPGRQGRAKVASRPGEQAVSTVLGAVLMFGLFFLTLVMVQVRFVPVWDEDREARHMDEVLGEMAQVKSDLDRQVDNRTDVAIKDPLVLEREPGFRLFRSASQAAELGFEPGDAGGGVLLSSPRLTVLVSGGRSFYGITDPSNWAIIDGTADTYLDIEGVRALRLRILLPPTLTYYTDGDNALLDMYDSSGTHFGQAVVTFRDLPSEWALQVQIYADTDSDGAVDDEVSSDLEAFFQQTGSLQYMYIDLLDPSLLFDAILASGDGPLEMRLTRNGLEADYVVVYDAAGGGGVGTSGGAIGLILEPYAPAPYEGGLLRFSANNQQFVAQDYVIEHGAVLRVQPDGAVMAVEPNFAVTRGTVQTRLDWALPSLLGVGQQLGGTHSASVSLDPSGSRDSFEGTAYSFTLSIPSAYPSPWEAFLDRELREAGLSETAGDYTLTSDADSADLTLTGLDTSTTVDDLFVVFHQAEITVDLATTG